MVRFAVFGDVHGKQDLMYQMAIQWQEENGKTIDCILQVGDFETILKPEDFEHYYAPERYHHLSDIADYIPGFKQAHIFTIFTGGNHEAWGVLANYNDGGFIVPDIYYLGRAGVFEFQDVRVGGLTGIYKKSKFKQALSEKPNYDWKYFRNKDIDKLKNKDLDILLLHQWFSPLSEINIKDEHRIPWQIKESKFVTPTYNLVKTTKPKYVFMGHMHKAYLEGNLDDTTVFGLPNISEEKNPNSMKIIEFVK